MEPCLRSPKRIPTVYRHVPCHAAARVSSVQLNGRAIVRTRHAMGSAASAGRRPISRQASTSYRERLPRICHSWVLHACPLLGMARKCKHDRPVHAAKRLAAVQNAHMSLAFSRRPDRSPTQTSSLSLTSRNVVLRSPLIRRDRLACFRAELWSHTGQHQRPLGCRGDHQLCNVCRRPHGRHGELVFSVSGRGKRMLTPSQLTVLACGEASVGPSGTVVLAGGTLSGLLAVTQRRFREG